MDPLFRPVQSEVERFLKQLRVRMQDTFLEKNGSHCEKHEGVLVKELVTSLAQMF